MKITFVYPDFEYRKSVDGYYTEAGGWYHEGIAQLGAIAEEMKWETDLVHLTGPVTEEHFKEEIKQRKPDVVGLSALRVGNLEFARLLAKWSHEVLPKAIIIMGGYLPTLEPQKAIDCDCVDAVFIGEGEVPLRYFLGKVQEGKDYSETPSTWVKTKKGIVKNAIAPLVEDLDSLPLPKFDMFDFKKLIGSQLKIALGGITRGCPYNCTYCWNNRARKLYPNNDKYVRFRSPRNAVDYLKKLIAAYPGAKKIRFQDDIWPIYKDWGEELKDLYVKEIGLPFDCNYRVNLFNEERAKLLKDMGCVGVYFGVESGDEKIRNMIYKRGMKVEEMEKAFEISRKYGIMTYAYNIVGAPYENLSTALETVKLNAKLKPDVMFFAIYYPYGGSDLHELSITAGFFDPDQPIDHMVNLKMPDFPREQVIFAQMFAKLFVKLYEVAWSLPGGSKGGIGKAVEKMFDGIWLSKYTPRKFMNFCMIGYRAFIMKLKMFIKEHLTPLYFVLRKSNFVQWFGRI